MPVLYSSCQHSMLNIINAVKAEHSVSGTNMQPTPSFKMQHKHRPDSSPESLFKTLHAVACSFHIMESFVRSCVYNQEVASSVALFDCCKQGLTWIPAQILISP